MKLLLIFIGIAVWALLSGCTRFHVVQTDETPGERIVTTKVTATAWFSSAQNLTKIKALNTDKTQSFGSDSLGQQGATNTVEALKAIDSILSKVHP